jgi:hypothetical protein
MEGARAQQKVAYVAKALLAENLVDETAAAVGFSGDVVIIYGANLMFMDMELVGLYGLDI